MPIEITWVDNCQGEIKLDHLVTPVCALQVHRCGDVITRIDWDFTERPASKTDTQAAGFWPEPKQTVQVKLLKQGSAHQHKVWAELLKIPPGATLTYSEIAKKIGSAARAVGNACRANPYTLLIPCHRVVSVNGLGGYSGQRHGDYMKIKEKLLAYEADAVKSSKTATVETEPTGAQA